MLKSMTGNDSDGVPEPSGSPNNPYPVNWKKVVLSCCESTGNIFPQISSHHWSPHHWRGGLGPGRADHPGAKPPHKSVEGW